jgi:hypothetical protein
MKFETPEIKLNMDVRKDQAKASKNIKLIRDEKGNLIGAEANERIGTTGDTKNINLVRDEKGNLIGAELKGA